MRLWLVRLLTGAAVCAAVLGTGSAAFAQDAWRLPLDGPAVVTRPFEPPADPYGPGHRGVDLAAAPGAVVHAAGAGTIGYAGLLAGRGVVTVLHEGGLRTTYEPVTVDVRAGQPVAIGAALGTLAPGHAGCPVAACLHWGLLRGDVYLDPMSLLSPGPVRLLPPASSPAVTAAALPDPVFNPSASSTPAAGTPAFGTPAFGTSAFGTSATGASPSADSARASESDTPDALVPAGGAALVATTALGLGAGALTLGGRRRPPGAPRDKAPT